MGKFRGLCNRLYDFKIVFEFVPNDDKYVSLVAGSITAIIKVLHQVGYSPCGMLILKPGSSAP